jgi:hypothetical protein
MSSPLEITTAWQQAANDQDAERLLALSDLNIEVVGPRGAGYGHQLLRDWLGRAGLALTTLRAFARGETVVLAQRGVWRSIEGGDMLSERDLASRFDVRDGRVVRFARYDSLDQALEASGLGLSDELSAVNRKSASSLDE